MAFAFFSCDTSRDYSSAQSFNIQVRAGDHTDSSVIDNYDNVEVSFSYSTITVEVVNDLVPSDSTAGKGNGNWVALLIDIGISDLTNVSFDGELLESDGAGEYQYFAGGKSSEIVLWINAADNQYIDGRDVKISADGFRTRTLKIVVKIVATDTRTTTEI